VTLDVLGGLALGAALAFATRERRGAMALRPPA